MGLCDLASKGDVCAFVTGYVKHAAYGRHDDASVLILDFRTFSFHLHNVVGHDGRNDATDRRADGAHLCADYPAERGAR